MTIQFYLNIIGLYLNNSRTNSKACKLFGINKEFTPYFGASWFKDFTYLTTINMMQVMGQLQTTWGQ